MSPQSFTNHRQEPHLCASMTRESIAQHMEDQIWKCKWFFIQPKVANKIIQINTSKWDLKQSPLVVTVLKNQVLLEVKMHPLFPSLD